MMAMKIPKLPIGVRVIECVSIEFDCGNIVEVKHFDDFTFLLAGNLVVKRLNNKLYNMLPDKVYIYTILKKK